MGKHTIASYKIDLNEEPDISFGSLTFYRKKNPDGIVPVIADSCDGRKAILLGVKTGAYNGPLDEPSDNANDRCELREAKSLFGTEVWYGFSIRIPEGFPIRPLRFVVAQLKMPCAPSEDISPAFALRIDNGHWLATIEHLYEPKDKQQGRYLSEPNDGDCGLHAALAFDHHNFDASRRGQTDYQVRAILALDGAGLPAHLRECEFTKCTTGVEVHRHALLPSLSRSWVDFVLHFAPSGIKDVDGLFELYANQSLIAQAWGEFGFAGTKTPDQYFKIGPYRNNDSKWGEEVAAIEVRDIRRGPRPENVGIPCSVAIAVQDATT
jgi:hypothetical protein